MQSSEKLVTTEYSPLWIADPKAQQVDKFQRAEVNGVNSNEFVVVIFFEVEAVFPDELSARSYHHEITCQICHMMSSHDWGT